MQNKVMVGEVVDPQTPTIKDMTQGAGNTSPIDPSTEKPDAPAPDRETKRFLAALEASLTDPDWSPSDAAEIRQIILEETAKAECRS